MVEQRFSDVMTKERDRLQREREEIFDQRKELDNKLISLNRELAAIDAYEAAKSGRQATAVATGRGDGGRRRQRRGSRREALLQLIGANPEGLTRGEILKKMGLKGDRSGEMSVSNALTAMTKRNQLSRVAGKYRAA